MYQEENVSIYRTENLEKGLETVPFFCLRDRENVITCLENRKYLEIEVKKC